MPPPPSSPFRRYPSQYATDLLTFGIIYCNANRISNVCVIRCTGSSCMRKESIVDPHPTELGYLINHMSAPADDGDAEMGRRMSTASMARNQWRGSGSLRASRNSIVAPLSALDSQVVLGPGQIQPKGYRLTSERYGELKLGLSKVKGTVEVEVSGEHKQREVRSDTNLLCNICRS